MQGAEAAGDLLLGLFHADVALGAVIGEGHLFKDREGQHIELEIFQPVEQVGSLALWSPAFSPGMAPASLGENGTVLGPDPFKGPLAEHALALAPLQTVEQEAAHLRGPAFLMFLG